MQSPWYILGAGSIGCLFAAYLHRAGVPVVLILRDAQTMAIWKQQGGIRLEHNGQSGLLAVPACTALQLTAPIRQLLICTKAQQTMAAVSSLQRVLAADAILVLLQNGLGVREEIQSQWPQAKILHALSTEGAYRTERFSVVHAGRGETVIGAPATRGAAFAATVADVLHCELNIVPVGDIASRLWLKLAVNSVINPLTALHECRNGELLKLPNIHADVAALCSELSAVANAAGQKFLSEELQAQVFAVMRGTAENRSSMLQDIEQHRPTEIDFINGYVVRLAREFGLHCPRHEELLRAVQKKSFGFADINTFSRD